ncbi:SGNH/GDSL hydrolase family protein [Mariniplasma anaerobium]|uniref:Lipase/acylhydrolase n=1 Tax=Mariniplasma anaerobium TaxID=2735436 RepID=A0A7U9XXG2_9MOLU|nr:SGNH/GDSL hydrolase family protein [Mariniplasma anaerobium]BCR35474.1 lipase/acylhydrolase [Mariniplasma anaerobium]
MRTVVFGDSIAKGIVTIKGKLETVEDNAVKLVSKYYGQEIDNVSLYGQTLKRIYDKKIVDKYLKSTGQADQVYAVFALGGNDSDYDWEMVSKNPYIKHNPKTPLKDFERMLIDMIETLTSKGIKVVLTTIISLNSQSYFDNVISKMGDPKNMMIFLEHDVENISRHQEMYSQAIVRCATKTNCILLDLREKMKSLKDIQPYMCSDGVHPNEKGYYYLAQSAIQEINQYDLLNTWRKTPVMTHIANV